MSSASDPLSDPQKRPPPSLHIALLGTGLYGRALASHITRHAPQHTLTTASRTTATPPCAAVASADVVILAVPSSAHASLLADLSPSLPPSALLIDVSNTPLHILPHAHRRDPSPALALAAAAPPAARVVKALNTLSPQLLATRAAAGAPVPFAADDSAAADAAAFIASLGFAPRHLGSLQDAARDVEALPHAFFPALKSSALVAAVVWLWWILYATLSSYVIHGRRGEPSRPWDKAPLSILMASTGEAAMTMFAITFLAGPLARLVQLARGSVSKPFGKLFSSWLDDRKELGLVAFVFVSAHGIAGAISASHLDDDWKGQLYFVFGILSYMMFALLALSSGSAISSNMSWAEFRAVFSWLGTLGLILGVAHQALWGVILHKHRPDPSFWVADGAIMPIYWVGIMLPLAALLLRAITWTPCIALPYKRIGQGSAPAKEISQA